MIWLENSNIILSNLWLGLVVNLILMLLLVIKSLVHENAHFLLVAYV